MTINELSKKIGVSHYRISALIKKLEIDNQREITDYHGKYDLNDAQEQAIEGYFLLQDFSSEDNPLYEAYNQVKSENLSQHAEIKSLKNKIKNLDFDLALYEIDKTEEESLKLNDFKAMAESVHEQAKSILEEFPESDDSDDYTFCLNKYKVLRLISGLYRWIQYRHYNHEEDPCYIDSNGNVFKLLGEYVGVDINLSKDVMTNFESQSVTDALNKIYCKDYRTPVFSFDEQKLLTTVIYNVLTGVQSFLYNCEWNMLFDIFSKLMNSDLDASYKQMIVSELQSIRAIKFDNEEHR